MRIGLKLSPEGQQDLVKIAQLLRRETAGAVGGQGQDVDQPVGEPDGHRDIIGAALIDQFLQDREIELRVRSLGAPANTVLPRDYRGERAVLALSAL